MSLRSSTVASAARRGRSLSSLRSSVLSEIPWRDILGLLESLAAAGFEKDDSIGIARGFLDDVLTWDSWELSDGAKAVLEAADGPVIEALLHVAWSAVEVRRRRAQRQGKARGRSLSPEMEEVVRAAAVRVVPPPPPPSPVPVSGSSVIAADIDSAGGGL